MLACSTIVSLSTQVGKCRSVAGDFKGRENFKYLSIISTALNELQESLPFEIDLLLGTVVPHWAWFAWRSCNLDGF